MNNKKNKEAKLTLKSGHIFFGEIFGSDEPQVGEIIFNTSMSGYQEVITDLSYTDQIVCFTYPHIGNVGTNNLDKAINFYDEVLQIINLKRKDTDEFCAGYTQKDGDGAIEFYVTKPANGKTATFGN